MVCLETLGECILLMLDWFLVSRDRNLIYSVNLTPSENVLNGSIMCKVEKQGRKELNKCGGYWLVMHSNSGILAFKCLYSLFQLHYA